MLEPNYTGTKPTDLADVQAELSEIRQLLRKFEKRDKWRTFWGSIGGIVRLIPLLLTLYFSYYFYVHGEEMIADIMKKSFNFSTSMFKNDSADAMIDQGYVDKIKSMINNE